jgi:hypothetical protein
MKYFREILSEEMEFWSEDTFEDFVSYGQELYEKDFGTDAEIISFLRDISETKDREWGVDDE